MPIGVFKSFVYDPDFSVAIDGGGSGGDGGGGDGGDDQLPLLSLLALIVIPCVMIFVVAVVLVVLWLVRSEGGRDKQLTFYKPEII